MCLRGGACYDHQFKPMLAQVAKNEWFILTFYSVVSLTLVSLVLNVTQTEEGHVSRILTLLFITPGREGK